MKSKLRRRRVCFVTGTRAEFGLMQPVLRAVADDRRLQLQIVVTGMHLDRGRGYSAKQVLQSGWKPHAVVPWRRGESAVDRAEATGLATAKLARVFERLASDIVLVTGDRVEALAAATAGHLCDRVVAHVHGGDRALGQADDSMRHAITKLSHLHFPATRASAARIAKLGEDAWRIHRVGSPGIDGIQSAAAGVYTIAERFPQLKRHRFALFCLHPTEANAEAEAHRTSVAVRATLGSGVSHVLALLPNNDPGSSGIARVLRETDSRRVTLLDNLPREHFLGLLRDAAVLVGNSSSGIIEAGSFGTPVINIGPRQAGRERGKNVTDVPFIAKDVERAIASVWSDGQPRRFRSENIYGIRGESTAARVVRVLATQSIDLRLLRKLIHY